MLINYMKYKNKLIVKIIMYKLMYNYHNNFSFYIFSIFKDHICFYKLVLRKISVCFLKTFIICWLSKLSLFYEKIYIVAIENFVKVLLIIVIIFV